MPQVRYAPEVHEDFARLTSFLQEVAPEKISEAMGAIIDGLEILEHTPFAGEPHPLDGASEMRRFVIPYGRSGYVALYSFSEAQDLVTIHALRHQKELNFLTRVLF